MMLARWRPLVRKQCDLGTREVSRDTVGGVKQHLAISVAEMHTRIGKCSTRCLYVHLSDFSI